MTNTEHLAWFIVMAMATFAILVVGTLIASDLMPRVRRGPRGHEHAVGTQPRAQQERIGASADPHP